MSETDIKSTTIKKFHVIDNENICFFEDFLESIGLQMIFLGEEKNYVGRVYAIIDNSIPYTKKLLNNLKKEANESEGFEF